MMSPITANFHDMCKDFKEVFMDHILKNNLTTVLVITTTNWNVDFELM